MTFSQESPSAEAAQAAAGRAFRLPVGAFSPLWAMFGAAAGAGVAYWWMTSWTRAVNVEALAGDAPKALAAPEPVALIVGSAVAAADIAEATVEEVADAVAAAVETAPVDAALDDLALAQSAAADDLTALTGIGPKLSAALAERGVTRFAQIAAWTADELAAIDAALGLKGRAVREAWVAQAKRLAGDA